MKRFTILFASLIIGAMLINSCSDSDKSTDGPDNSSANYYPTTTGSYWVNENTFDDGDDVIIDSVVVSGTEMVKGKNASVLSSYIAGSPIPINRYAYVDDSKLYGIAKDLLPAGLGDLIPSDIIPEDWVEMADFKSNNKKTIFTKPFEELELNLGGTDLTISGNFEISIQNKGKVAVQTPASTFDAVHNEITFSFNGKVGIAFSPFPVPLSFDILSSFYYSENVGEVKREIKHQSIEAMGMTLFDIPQSSSVLLRYNIVK